MTHVVLVGLMGTGKTTVGKIVAERLGRPFADSDELIRLRTGRTVREIFRSEGEAVFRAHESEQLGVALASDVPAVIAAAAGVVLSGADREVLRSADAEVVWLRADPQLLVDRVGSAGHRPLLDDDPAGTLTRMARDREHLYQEVADVIVDIDGLDVPQVAEAVIAATAAEER